MTEAHRGPGYEPERGPEYDVDEEDDGVDDDEPFNFRLHLHQCDPDDRDTDAGGGGSDDSEVGVSDGVMGTSGVVGLGSFDTRKKKVGKPKTGKLSFCLYYNCV